MKKILHSIGLSLLMSICASALAADLNVYGPGGPAPVIKQLAKLFEQKTGKQINVIAGPPANWQQQAQQDADVFFSGSSVMTNQFAMHFPQKISLDEVEVLNIREAGILVRPSNPKNIRSFEDILRDDINVMVVDGSGQLSLWEDMALKNGNIKNLEALRENIQVFAKNSGEAMNRWKMDSSLDAIIIWKHWQNKDAKFVPAGKKHVIYRASEAVIASDTKNKDLAEDFVDFLQSDEVQNIWREKGWVGNES